MTKLKRWQSIPFLIYSTGLYLVSCQPLPNVNFDLNYFLVEFKPYTKYDTSFNKYSLEEIISMEKVVNKRFSTIATDSMGVYDFNAPWDSGYALAFVARAASFINLEAESLKLSVILGALLYPDDDKMSEREVQNAIDAAVDANTRFNGTVTKIAIVSQNLTHFLKILGQSCFSKDLLQTSIQYGITHHDVDKFVEESEAQDVLKLVDFVISKILTSDQTNARLEAERIGKKFLEQKSKIIEMNPKVEFYGLTAISSLNQDNHLNLITFWTLMERFARIKKTTVIMDVAINLTPWKYWSEAGWWKRVRNDTSDETAFVEKFTCKSFSCEETYPIQIIPVHRAELNDNGKKSEEQNNSGVIIVIVASIAGFGILGIVLIIILWIACKRLKVQSNGGDDDAKSQRLQNNYGTLNEPSFQELMLDNSYEILRHQITFDPSNVIGMGEFGVVYKARVEGFPEDVALKIIHSLPQEHSREVGIFLSEIKVMIRIGIHPYVVSIVGACLQDFRNGEVLIASEFCVNGSLEKHLREQGKVFRSSLVATGEKQTFFKQCVKWSQEIALGMEYIASKNVVHADLAARNVLLTDKMIAKITDFGLSRHMYMYENYMKKQKEPLPWRWMAIESLLNLEFSTKTDVWSYGVTLWEIFSYGAVPYPGLSWVPNFTEDLTMGLRMSRPELGTEEIYDVMKSCWEIKPEERPGFNELVAFFENHNQQTVG